MTRERAGVALQATVENKKKGFGHKNSECVNIKIPSGWLTFRVSISSHKMIRKGRRTHCSTGS